MPFEAFRIHQQGKDVRAGFEQLEVDDLTEGDVVIKVHYSTKARGNEFEKIILTLDIINPIRLDYYAVFLGNGLV